MNSHSEKVRDFYNEYNHKFVQVYGNIIQAFRTKDIDKYLAYTDQSIGFFDNSIALDAGCGIAGPAIYFAKQHPTLKIEACTISGEQRLSASKLIEENKLQNQINCRELDYHHIDSAYDSKHFNVIYFLESFGHSNKQQELIHTSWNALKEEGVLYIKDLFRKEYEDEWMQLRSDEIVSSINRSYQYYVPELSEVLSSIRKKGFIIDFIRSPQVEIGDFEHLSISNEFQNIFDVDKIESWDDYVFPIDFYEIRAVKPKDYFRDLHLHHLNK
jgi:2-polyprenyl-3-methyl-5-hydroxy-6-metoxy-1,4-benzoquinol methylase